MNAYNYIILIFFFVVNMYKSDLNYNLYMFYDDLQVYYVFEVIILLFL